MNKLILNIAIIVFAALGAIHYSYGTEPDVVSGKEGQQNGITEKLLALNAISGKDSTQQSKALKDTSAVSGKPAKKSGKGNFIDLDGDGINDNRMQGKCKTKGKDCFIDKDGDGINDNRCQGSGFCKQKRQRKCCPKGK
jgi:hypothetical protein